MKFIWASNWFALQRSVYLLWEVRESCVFPAISTKETKTFGKVKFCIFSYIVYLSVCVCYSFSAYRKVIQRAAECDEELIGIMNWKSAQLTSVKCYIKRTSSTH